MNYLYIGLLRGLVTGVPTLGLVEVPGIGTNYRRVEMGPFDWIKQNEFISNIATIKFPIALSGWGVITHFGVFDLPCGGSILVTGKLTEQSIVNKDTQMQFDKISVELSSLKLDRRQDD